MLSARNPLDAIVKSVRLGNAMTGVAMEVNGADIAPSMACGAQRSNG
jgi:hypothetical protein